MSVLSYKENEQVKKMEKRALEETQPGMIYIRNVARGIAYPSVDNVVNIPAWSRGSKPWNVLSPFNLGPVKFEEDGKVKECATFETWWQSFKVWKDVDGERHVDDTKDQLPNEAWHKWHDTLLANPKPIRRPNGRAIPLYAWWREQKLDVVQARKELYIPYAQRLYRAHPMYRKLFEMVYLEGKNICILEPDGPQHFLFPDGVRLDLETLRALQNVTQLGQFPNLSEDQIKTLKYTGADKKYVPYGHGYVLALTLLEDAETCAIKRPCVYFCLFGRETRGLIVKFGNRCSQSATCSKQCFWSSSN